MDSPFNYWRLVCSRAWSQARRLLIPHSAAQIVVRIVLISCSLAILYAAKPYLVGAGLIDVQENPAIDNLVPIAATATTLVALLVFYFIIEMTLISPYRIWKEVYGLIVDSGPLNSFNSFVDFTYRVAAPNKAAQSINLIVTPQVALENVVVIGRFALLTHYLSHACWTWSLPIRLHEATNLLPNEAVEVPLIARERLSTNPADKILILDTELPSRENTDFLQGQMVKVEVSVHAGGRSATYSRVYNFRRAEGRQFIDTLAVEPDHYGDDDRTL